jgi:hypothetical protein
MVSIGYPRRHTIAKLLVGRSSRSAGIAARPFSLVAFDGRDTGASNDVAQGADFTIRNRLEIGTKPRRQIDRERKTLGTRANRRHRNLRTTTASPRSSIEIDCLEIGCASDRANLVVRTAARQIAQT